MFIHQLSPMALPRSLSALCAPATRLRVTRFAEGRGAMESMMKTSDEGESPPSQALGYSINQLVLHLLAEGGLLSVNHLASLRVQHLDTSLFYSSNSRCTAIVPILSVFNSAWRVPTRCSESARASRRRPNRARPSRSGAAPSTDDLTAVDLTREATLTSWSWAAMGINIAEVDEAAPFTNIRKNSGAYLPGYADLVALVALSSS
ncbi:hypothetical protein C8J57DRAFT_1605577 [Mycena rebaudengoi]|nr:hypothetical protein C8J57DRAFT_1605577 [Mycena rebaudengoi]